MLKWYKYIVPVKSKDDGDDDLDFLEEESA